MYSMLNPNHRTLQIIHTFHFSVLAVAVHRRERDVILKTVLWIRMRIRNFCLDPDPELIKVPDPAKSE